MSRARVVVRRAFAVVVAGTVLAACGASDAGEAATDGPVEVVTSTDVWADVVSQIGGSDVDVTAIITDPAADPHSFEPNAQAQLAVSKAGLLVQNGGGYDEWMTTLIDAASTSAPLIVATDLAGAEADHAPESHPAGAHAEDGHDHGELNEHVWYDLEAVRSVGHAVADQLGRLRPVHAATFVANLAEVESGLSEIQAGVRAIRDAHDGTPIAVTEPVPLDLTDASGLIDRTPTAFSEAIEEGTDVPPVALRDTLALVEGGDVAIVVYNEQTSSPETEQVRAAADTAGIPVVAMTETLPEGKDFLTWMTDNVASLAAALG